MKRQAKTSKPGERRVRLRVAKPSRPQAAPEIRVLDGKRVRIEGADEIVLECGKASITLRRNGKIVIRGAYVETHSEGTNRIKGAQVKLN